MSLDYRYCCKHLTEKGFEIEFAQPNKSEIPHVVAKQGEQLILF